MAGRLFFLSWLWSWQQQQQQRSSAEGALGLAVAARSTACLQGTGSVASEQRKPLKVTCTVEGGGGNMKVNKHVQEGTCTDTRTDTDTDTDTQIHAQAAPHVHGTHH